MANLSTYDQTNFFSSNVTLSHLLEPDDLCYVIKEEIGSRIKDSDFEDMYKDGGRPPISPRLLILVLLMQFLEGLSDRAAIRNLKFRLDWKIAFGLPVDFLGFHSSTLTYFRDRLIANSKATYAFDKILAYLAEKGLIKQSGQQRIDSTHIIAAVRELTRIELLHETIRLFCLDLGLRKKQMSETVLELHSKYTDTISTFRMTKGEKTEAIKEAGLAMRTIRDWVETLLDVQLLGLASFKTLKTVFSQNFIDQGIETIPELIKIATGKEHICNPHDPDAEYGNKGKKGWLGYKLQVVETAEGEQNFITHIELENATNFDGDSVCGIIEELENKGVSPSNLYGDTHYNTSANIELLAEKEIELKGPVAPVTKQKQEKDEGFAINIELQKVICPEGIESKHFHIDPSGRIKASFPKKDCLACSRKEICQPQPRGKIYEQRPENKTLSVRRKKMLDPAYQKDLHRRNGIEGTLSGLVRGQKIRRLKYRGKAKGQLQTKMTGAAANVMRLHGLRQRQMRAKVLTAA